MSNPREIESPKGIESLETIIKRYENVIRKLEIELKELDTTKKELEELEAEAINETIAIIPKERLLFIFFYIRLFIFFENVKQSIKQANEKEVCKKCIRVTEILKDVMTKLIHMKSN